MRRLTRRSLLRAAGGTSVAITLGQRPWSPAVASAAVAGPHLRRASYRELAGSTFTVVDGGRSVGVRLTAVGDLSERLAGRDDAFALTFSGGAGAGLDSGIHALRHPVLGRFELFLSPVDRGAGHYQAVIDRSVGVPQDPPAPVRSLPATAPGVPAAAAPAAAGVDAGHEPVLRRATLRRLAHGVRCEILLRRDRRAVLVRCRLLRNGHAVASGTQTVQAGRARLRLHSAHRVKRGAYVLAVSVTYADGSVVTQRKHLRLR